MGNAVLVGETRERLGAAATLATAWVVILVAVLGIGWLLTHSLESIVEPWDSNT